MIEAAIFCYICLLMRDRWSGKIDYTIGSYFPRADPSVPITRACIPLVGNPRDMPNLEHYVDSGNSHLCANDRLVHGGPRDVSLWSQG